MQRKKGKDIKGKREKERKNYSNSLIDPRVLIATDKRTITDFMCFVLGIHLLCLVLFPNVGVRSIYSVFLKNGVPFKIDRFVTDCQAMRRFSVSRTIIHTCHCICHL